MYGGSPIRRTVLDEAIDLLPNTEFFQSYGSHEAGSISYLNHADHQDPMLRSSAGKPLLAAAVQLGNVNADGIGRLGMEQVLDELCPTDARACAVRQAIDGLRARLDGALQLATTLDPEDGQLPVGTVDPVFEVLEDASRILFASRWG